MLGRGLDPDPGSGLNPDPGSGLDTDTGSGLDPDTGSGLDPDPMLGLTVRPGLDPDSGLGGIMGLAAVLGFTATDDGLVKPGTLTGAGLVTPDEVESGFLGTETWSLEGRFTVDCSGCLLVMMMQLLRSEICKFMSVCS